MASLRRQFEEDYAAVFVTEKNKKREKIRYVYDAPWYLWDLPENELKKKKLFLSGLSAAGLALLLIVGSRDCSINQCSVTAVLGTVSLALHVLELFRMAEFLAAKYRTERMTWNSVNRILRTVPMVRGGCLAGAFIGGVLFMARQFFMARQSFMGEASSIGGQVFSAGNLAAAFGYLICSLLAFTIAAEYRKIPLRTEKNENERVSL